MDKPAWMNAVVYGNQLRIVQVANPHMMSLNFGWGFIIFPKALFSLEKIISHRNNNAPFSYNQPNQCVNHQKFIQTQPKERP